MRNHVTQTQWRGEGGGGRGEGGGGRGQLGGNQGVNRAGSVSQWEAKKGGWEDGFPWR